MVSYEQLAEHYGENWHYVRELLEELTKQGVWKMMREANLTPVVESLQSDQNANALAREILQKRVENRVLHTLEQQFSPKK